MRSNNEESQMKDLLDAKSCSNEVSNYMTDEDIKEHR